MPPKAATQMKKNRASVIAHRTRRDQGATFHASDRTTSRGAEDPLGFRDSRGPMRTLILLALAFVTGCVATGYQPQGFRGGYSETQLGENVFRVDFAGNGFTSPARAADFALLRSAEVALEHGFRFFVVAGQTEAATVSGGGGNYGATVTAPSSLNTIVCYKEKPADAGPLVYDAEIIRKTMRAKYDLE